MAGVRRILGIPVSDLMAERRGAAITFAVGLIVLLAVQLPAVERSMLGEPDRELMEAAFKMRTDVVGGTADPVLFLDIDDRTLTQTEAGRVPPFTPPATTAPRKTVAALLNFIRTSPPGRTPKAVILDVDIGAPASDGPAGEAALAEALAAWAASPSAPNLIIAREAYAPASLGMGGDVKVLPDTPYEAIVQPAPNIYWSTVKVLADQNGVAREFLPYECVLTSTGTKPLYSAALLAYGFMEDPKVLEKAHAGHWMKEAGPHCDKQPAEGLTHGERVNYHLSLELGFQGRVWPDLDKAWPGFKTCGGSGGDSAIFRVLSVADILAALQAGGDLSHELLCQRLVIIGGTNGVAADFVQTPINEMNGSVLLANAVRGLQLSGGGLRAIPLIAQCLVLLVVSLVLSWASAATEEARRQFSRIRATGHQRKLRRRIAMIMLNPIVLNGTIAFAAHFLGVGLLLVSLNFGIWSFLSAPVLASAIAETIQEFADAS